MKRPAPQYEIDPTVARRLDVLEKLIDEEYEGKTKVFQDRTGIKMAQVSQWFTGYRALRDKALKRLEASTGKEDGFFDGFSSGATNDPIAALPERLKAALMTLAGMFQSIPDDQWGNAVMEIAELLRKDQRFRKHPPN